MSEDFVKNALEELETKIAFHEDTLDALNETLISQQLELKQVRALLDTLILEFRNLQKTDEPAVIDQKPPHY